MAATAIWTVYYMSVFSKVTFSLNDFMNKILIGTHQGAVHSTESRALHLLSLYHPRFRRKPFCKSLYGVCLCVWECVYPESAESLLADSGPFWSFLTHSDCSSLLDAANRYWVPSTSLRHRHTCRETRMTRYSTLSWLWLSQLTHFLFIHNRTNKIFNFKEKLQ